MSQPSVVIAYKTKNTANTPYSAGGLAANALHSVAVLRHMGIEARLLPVTSYADMKLGLKPTDTHLIVEALWLTQDNIRDLAQNTSLEIVIRAHSKIGFLQVEPEAVTLARWIIGFGRVCSRVRFASNNEEFAEAMGEVYGDTLYLPNLYDVHSAPKIVHEARGPLRIASFGATRLLKMHPNAALAALQIAERMAAHLEFYVNVDNTPGGESVRRTVANLLVGVADLHEVAWQDSETFRKTIAGMDLVLQLSATETFCLVAADAVASGVPVVSGPAITWLPKRYQAPIDDTSKVADIGVDVLMHRAKAAKVQGNALNDFDGKSREEWAGYLGVQKKRRGWFF